MAGQKNSKLKLLYLKEIFEKYTDENHILNALEIAEKLGTYGIECERKSIYKDIDILTDYGMDIVKARTPKNGFFLASRDWELAEVRLLFDAVQSADFITKKKTLKMLNKIENCTSVYQGKNLRSQVYIDNRNKCTNEEIFYSIDTLDNAIKNKQMVKLIYSKRKLDEKYAALTEKKEFTVSPYALIWSNDHYYLVANNAKYDNLMHLRIDRMSKVTVLQEEARDFSQVSDYTISFDAADYAEKSFNMFSGKTQVIELMCNSGILEEMLDRFGERPILKKGGTDNFYIRAEAIVNDGLVSWIMQFGDKIKVVCPDELAKMVEEKAKGIIAVYSKGNN